MTDILLKQLNTDQRTAATHPGGPALVMAGAGSGKTKVLTTRVAWLMAEHGVRPEQILLVTFTNKAAQEMNRRVFEMTGQQLGLSGTFHRIGATILRRHGHLVGLPPNYVIYDTDDQMSLLKQVYKDHNWDQREFHPKAIKAEISEAKNELLDWEEYQQAAKGAFQVFTGQVYQAYQRALRDQHAVDFDDLLVLLVRLFQNHPQVLAEYRAQITHVLVDEYQDTNRAQYLLTKMLSQVHQNLFVVGDFAQSIYAWRGADYRNMLNLKADFPDLTQYRLEQNYRSTQAILDVATAVMEKTTAHPVLKLWTDRSSPDKVTVIETPSSDQEALQVLSLIEQLRPGHNLNDFAILYRTNAQSRPFEEAFVRHGIPYRLVGGFKFYERKEIKDVLAYARLYLNPQDSVSAARCLKMGKRKLAVFQAWALDHPYQTETPPLEILKQILEITKYVEQFDAHDPEEEDRIENVQELLQVASQFTSLPVLLENIALVQDDALADVAQEKNYPAVTLMSLHSAKGLEFPVVFMVGMEESLLPHNRALLDRAQMEEERRLCYVGMTRAKDKLFLTYARQRWTYGSATYSLPSRFLEDIPDTLTEFVSVGQPYTRVQHPGVAPRWSGQTAKAPPSNTATAASGRRLIIDDGMLEGVLNGEIDIKSFLND